MRCDLERNILLYTLLVVIYHRIRDRRNTRSDRMASNRAARKLVPESKMRMDLVRAMERRITAHPMKTISTARRRPLSISSPRGQEKCEKA